MKKNTIFLLFFLFFLVSFCHSQWLLQPWPVVGGTYSIKFFDNNYGIASLDNPVVIRTTNGGVNWNIQKYVKMYNLQKINDSVMYGYGGPTLQSNRIYRTFNRGLTWDSVAIFGYTLIGISFINKDTGYVSGFDGNDDRIWKTINGGVTLTPLTIGFGWGKIFFLKYKINGEYYGWCTTDVSTYKTTNSGANWFQVGGTGGHGVWQLEFINENTGFATWGGDSILKSTNGGMNWVAYAMPKTNGIFDNYIRNFKIIDSNTIYGDRGLRQFPNSSIRGIIWKSTNGGVNWGFQQPDTSYHYGYVGIDFTDSLNGWSYNIHTTNGGGPITHIANISKQIADNFKLYQNYPNPFNGQTSIEYMLKTVSNVTFKVYDVTGKEVIRIFQDLRLSSGTYKTIIDFGKEKLSSGVYFYKIYAEDARAGTVFTDTKKMMYVK